MESRESRHGTTESKQSCFTERSYEPLPYSIYTERLRYARNHKPDTMRQPCKGEKRMLP